ncbi:MAG: hypothetical protein HC934_00030 [Acaryochloridaceae cyanobacterium SU_2_1]|nr:hypothetical protein [Acaryochloridaceae cyanobacterium SU_2_1]
MAELPQALGNLLTLEENAQIDQTLLPSRDRFSIRLTTYCWRYLQGVSASLDRSIETLQPDQILAWVEADDQLHNNAQVDPEFIAWFSHLLASSLKPLRAIAEQRGTPINHLALEQVIDWFVQNSSAEHQH